MPDEIPFSYAPASQASSEVSSWKILSVEDDANYRSSLALALETVEVEGRPIQLLCAKSAFEAAKLIPEHPDIGVILLDVVMESDHAGLSLVRTIREVIGNSLVRIVLLTGQPGMAPRLDVMKEYDIDDYLNKSDLTHDHLSAIITANIRSWDRSSQLERAKQGLQIITEASRTVSQARDVKAFAQEVLGHLARLLGAERGDIVCVQYATDNVESATVLVASGKYEAYAQSTLDQLPGCALKTAIQDSLSSHCNVFDQGCAVMNFSREDSANDRYLAALKTTRPLSAQEVNLLEVFCENMSTCLTNLKLSNQLHFLAYRDPELDLPNRNHFLRTLSHVLRSRHKNKHLLVIELGEFNEIGFHLGDQFALQLLAGVANVIRQTVTGIDECARIDRSSFALLTEEHSCCTQVADALKRPVQIDGGVYRVVTYAVCLPTQAFEGESSAQLLSIAEIAIEQARENRTDLLEVSEMEQTPILQRYHLLTRLRRALDNGELTIFLQPKVHLESGTLAGFEALVRWPQPDGTFIPPDQFIPLAERGGLISELDLQVLQATLAAVVRVKSEGIEVPISFNTSAMNLFRTEHFEAMVNMITSSGVDPRLLELELTESEAATEYTQISCELRQLLDMGLGVSIDDFGTGYSSLAHITNLAATVLKIDQSFVAGIGESTDAYHIIELILRLTDHFEFNVVAEGIESETQRQLLQRLGCHLGQGYLFAPPLPMDAAIKWAHAHQS